MGIQLPLPIGAQLPNFRPVCIEPLSQPKLVLDLATLEGCKAELPLDLVGWLHTVMVYPPKDGHPSEYEPGPP